MESVVVHEDVVVGSRRVHIQLERRERRVVHARRVESRQRCVLYRDFAIAIEFEAQHRWNNRLYNMALQMGYKSGYWRTFDYGRSAWVSTGIPFKPLTPDTWHHIVADFEIDYATGKRRLVAVGLDGTRKVPTQNSTLPALNSPGMNYTTFAAFQLDMNSSATDYHVFVDNYRFHWE